MPAPSERRSAAVSLVCKHIPRNIHPLELDVRMIGFVLTDQRLESTGVNFGFRLMVQNST